MKCFLRKMCYQGFWLLWEIEKLENPTVDSMEAI